MMMANARLSPDPAKHAAALIDHLGMPAARQLVQLYANDCPMGTYWPLVLAALRDWHPRIDGEAQSQGTDRTARAAA